MAGEYDKQFEQLTGLVTKVAGRVDEMRVELRDVNRKLDEHSVILNQHSKKLDEHSTRFDSVDHRFDRLESKLDEVAGRVLDHEKRLRTIERDRSISPEVN